MSLRQLTVKYTSLLGFSLTPHTPTKWNCSFDPLHKMWTSVSLEKPKLEVLYFLFLGIRHFFIHKVLPSGSSMNLDRRIILLEEVFQWVRQLVSFGRNFQMSINSFSTQML